MNYCSKCGNLINEEHKFCTKCGTKIEEQIECSMQETHTS